MKALPVIAALALLAACGQKPVPAPEPEKPDTKIAAGPKTAPDRPSRDEIAGEKDAAAALRSYYALIEKGDYEAATRLRSDRQTAPERLADNFRAYERYRAQVGVPGRPVRGGDWLYVRVQVMITGSYKGGKGFGSTGTVTMRRSVSETAGPAEREWRVYTG